MVFYVLGCETIRIFVAEEFVEVGAGTGETLVGAVEERVVACGYGSLNLCERVGREFFPHSFVKNGQLCI